MSWLLVLCLGVSEASPESLQEAIEQEVARAQEGLSLGDSGPPWRITVDWVDVASASYSADWGALIDAKVYSPAEPLRYLRTEVRQGGPEFDSGDMDFSPSAIFRRIPTELDSWNLSRALWLQLDASYKAAVSGLTQKTMLLNGKEPTRPAVAPVVPLSESEWPALSIDADWVRETTLALSAALTQVEGLEEAKSGGMQASTRVFTYSTEGMHLVRIYPEIIFRVQAKMRAPDGGVMAGSRSWVVRRRDQLPSLNDMLGEVREMGEILKETAEAPLLEDYIGPVLLEEEASVELFRQLLLPEILGTPPPVMSASFSEQESAETPRQARIGRRLLPFGWSVRDNAGVDAPGAYRWDYEGVEPEAVEMISDGVLQKPLMSRIPQDFESASTGHGRSQGSRRREAMPGVVFIQPPKMESQRKLERKALRAARAVNRDSVLVISRMETLALTRRLDVYFPGDEAPAGLSLPNEAYLLHRDGRRERVRLGPFVGVDRRALRDILAAGRPGPVRGVMDSPPSGLRYALSWNGGLQSGWSVPSVLISEMELVGHSGGENRLLERRP